MFGHPLDALLLSLAHQPLLQAFAIVVGTFILEDAATVLAAMRTAEGTIPLTYALAALYVGIILGDLGLYGAGRLASRIRWIERLLPPRTVQPAREWLIRHLGKAVVTSRFIPGMRLPTYTACGYLGVPFGQFALAVIGATLVWTSLLFGASLSFGRIIMEHLGAWRWAGAVGFAAGVVVLGRLASRLQVARR